MSRLDELIAKLCPSGVKYQPLKAVAFLERGTSITKSKATAGEYPVISGGREPAFYCDTFNRNGECITVAGSGAGAGFVQYWNEHIFVNDAFSVVGKEGVSTRYLYHFLSSIQERIYGTKKGGGIPHVHISSIDGFNVPVPPLKVQLEIVRILDNFTELSVELSDELVKRKNQYKGISTELFSHIKQSATIYSLSDICVIEKGKTPIQKAISGQYPLVVTTNERKSNNVYQFDTEAVCIPLVSSRGHGVASLNHVYYQDGKFALGNILCAVIPKDNSFVSAKYLFYYFEQTKDYTLVPLMKGGANVALHISDIEKIKVPIPSFNAQQTIITRLDTFEEYCNVALPSEIQARLKQLEYYRNRLLTFKEKA